MKVNRILYISLLILSISTLTGCYREIELIEVNEFSNIEIGLSGFKSNLEVLIYNPNFFPIQLEQTEISLKVRNVDAGEVRLIKAIKLQARDTTLIRLEVETRKGAISEILRNDVFSFFKGDEIPFTATGVIIGKSWGFRTETQINFTQNLTLKN